MVKESPSEKLGPERSFPFPEMENFIHHFKDQQPPINQGEVFDSRQEVKKILSMPSAERPEVLQKFHTKMIYQREGLAKMQDLIITLLRKYSDISFDKLHQVVDEYGHLYGLPDEYKEEAHEIIKKFKEKEDLIKHLHELYPDKRELFKAIFGRYPKGHIGLWGGLAMIYFSCDDPDDFVYVHSLAFVDDRKIKDEDIALAKGINGVTVGSIPLIPDLAGFVVVENNHRGLRIPDRPTYNHERQHVLHNFFQQENYLSGGFQGPENANTDSEREQALEGYLRKFRNFFVNKIIREEILAAFQEGFYRSKDIYERLRKKQDEGGSYDLIGNCSDILKVIFAYEVPAQYQPLLEKAWHNVFVVDYEAFLQQLVEIPVRLSSKYRDEEVVALLMNEPLEDWLKLTSRLLTEEPQ